MDATVAPPPRPRSVLFVCTGNTCRSPLAEGLARRLLAREIGCSPADLADRGWRVGSAGVAAMPGDAPSAPAILAAAECGFDLSRHRSRPVNPELLAGATFVVAVTRGHAVHLMTRFPGAGPRPELLCGPDEDLPDPVGGDVAEYRDCARAIEFHLRRHLAEWLRT